MLTWLFPSTSCCIHVWFGLVLGGAATYLGTSAVPPDREFADSAKAGLGNMLAARHRLSVATWNIAAINNNPFEYWITYEANPAYEELMKGVEKFLEDPGDKDVKVSSVFTEDMFIKLDTRLTGVGLKSVRNYWETDFKNRNIISGFMKVRYRTIWESFCFLVWDWVVGTLDEWTHTKSIDLF